MAVQGRFNQAIADCTVALAIDDKRADIRTLRAQAFYEIGKFDNAMADCDEAIRLNPWQFGAFQVRAQVWMHLHELDKVIADCTTAIRIEPDNLSGYGLRGYAWHLKRDYDKAIADYSETIKLDPNNPLAYYARGDARLRNGECDKAVADFTEGAKIDPEQNSRSGDPAARSAKNRWPGKEARDLLAFVRGEPADNPHSHENLKALAGTVATALADPAIERCNQTIVSNPDASPAYVTRARAWLERGCYTHALADSRKATQLDPKNAAVWDLFAQIRATCPDYTVRNGENAIQAATKACELTEWKNASYVSTLAAAYAETGDFASAVKWENRAIELEKDAKKKGSPARGSSCTRTRSLTVIR